MVSVHADGSKETDQITFNEAARQIISSDAAKPSTLQWDQETDRSLVLTGKWQESPLALNLHKTNSGPFALQTRGFHWIQEYLYHR